MHNATELRAALTMNSGARRAASTTGATARAMKLTIDLDDYTDPNEVNAILAAGYDVTLNLNGCTLTGNFVNEGTLTIVDTTGGGSIVGSITNEAGATLNVNGGSIVAGGNDPAITNKGTASVASGVTVTGAIEGSVTGIENAIVNVASVNGVGYNTFAAAVEALKNVAGEATVKLFADAVLDITAWETLAIGGDATTQITIDGEYGDNDFTLTFNKLNSDWNNVATNNNAKLVLKNMNINDSGKNNGPWNRYDINFACDVELINVVSAKALAFKAAAILNNVTINETGDVYAIWVQPNGQNISIDGLVVNCSNGRGIKVDEQYVDNPGNVALSVENATFTTAKKAAIMVKSSAETAITVGNNVDITNVAADNTNIAWVDADAAANYGDVTVINGTLAQEDVADFAVAAIDSEGNVIAYYAKLQNAVDACVAGANNIELLGDVTEDVKITQKEGVNIVIDGDGKKFTGIMTVFGDARHQGAETLAIKNVNFVAKAGADACVLSPDRTAQNPARYSYSHNVTVENCTFTDPDGAVNCAAIRQNDGGDRNWTVTKCTVDNTMHSLLQVNNVEGMLTVSECTVNSKNGLNLNATINATITGNNIDVKGYALRSGVSSGGNLGTAKTLVLEDNTLKSACGDGDAVIMFRASSVDMDLSMTKNVVEGTTHISGNTTATKIAADANYWDGETAPVTTGTAITVNSYYADAALSQLERNYLGGAIVGYTADSRIWGDAWGNATESYVVKVVDAEGNVMGTTSLNNVDGIIDGDVNVTWGINFVGASTDPYWTWEWTTRPSVNKMPAKVQLFVDGVQVSEGPVKLNAPDDLNKIVAATADADGNIIGCYTTVNAAVDNGDHVAILVPGTYSVPTGKNLTVTGAVDGVQFGPITTPNMGGFDYTYNNVTFNYAATSTYKGLQHTGDMVYNNCTFNGQVFLYGTSETFNKCTFNQESANAYNVWTYGAKEVAFNECTFNSAGKSVLVYTEDKNHNSDIDVTASTFNASSAVDGKAAIEMDASLQGSITLSVDAATTATGFSDNTLSGNSLWNDKMVVEGKYNGGTDTQVTVAGTVVKEFAATGLAGAGTAEDPYKIADYAQLIWFAEDVNAGNNYQGKFVQLTADIDLKSEPWTPITQFNGTFNGNDKTISNLVVNPNGERKSNQGFFGRTDNGEIKNLTINNATVKGRLAVGVVAGTPYTSKYTNIKVTGNVVVEGFSYVGGVGGRNAYASWTDITVAVNEGSYVKATSTEYDPSSSYADENGNVEYRTYVGGVIGFIGEGGHTFKNISSNIKVIGDVMDIGGIFGILHYDNNVENVTFTGSVEAPAGAKEVGAIAGVWHNQKGTAVEISGITSTGTVTVGGTTGEGAIVGGAYNASNVTPGTSGSLKIDGEEAWLSVAKIGDTTYRTVADALAAANDGETVTLLWAEGDPAIAMNGAVFGKNVTIAGTATVDWSKGWFFVGRGGEGNATVTFDGANLTSASANENSGLGIHVSGREKDTNNKYDGTLVIKNSTIALDYLINRGAIELGEGAVLTVKNGFGIAGRPASETENGEAATATVTLNNGSKLVVNNHNGMGLGQAATNPEGYGIMNVNEGATFEATQNFLVTANGTMNVNGGTVKMAEGKMLTNNGAIIVSGTDASTLDVATYEGNAIELRGGALADSNIGGRVNAFGINNISGTTKIGGILSLGYETNPTEQVVVNITGNFNGTNVIISTNNGVDNLLNVGVAEGARTTAHFGQLGAFGDVTINNADVTYGYAFIRNDMAVTNSALEIKGGVNTYFAGNAKVVIDNSTWSLPGYANIGSYGGYMYGNADVTLKNGSSITATNLGVELQEGKEVKLTIEDTSSLTATALSNTGSIVLASAEAKINANANVANVTTNVADYKTAYVNGVYTIVPMVYIVKVGDKQFETFEEALNVVENGQTIELYASATGSEINKEIEFTKDIEFTITGTAPNYELPVITFQNATVNIEDAEILIPELDARQGAVINVINSIVHDAGGNSIAKSYYNGAINIDANSTVHMMQVTTMGYINVAGTLNATWQTNVYGNGMITVKDGATFNTAALHLTAQDYNDRDNTDAERVGKPATIVVDAANLNIGKVKSDNGADYSYNSSKGINIGTIDGKNAVLDIKNGANVNIYMANGETANIGAGGTVNVAASTFNTVCRAADGSVTLANNGTVNVSGEANLAAAKVTGNGWFYMNGVSFDADTKLLGAKVRFASGTNNIDGSVINDGYFQVGVGAYNGVDANVDTVNGVIVNVKNNAIVGSNGNTYAGWVGTGFYDTDAEKAAAMTDAKYVLNIDNSIAEFGYIHVSNDGILNVNGVPANKAHYNTSDYAFYAGDFIINGTANFTATDVLAIITKVSCDNGGATPGTLNINAGTEYEAERHNGATAGTSFVLYKTGVANVAEGGTLLVGDDTSIAANAQLNIAGNVTAKGVVTGNGAINITNAAAKFTAAENLTVNSKIDDYKVVYADGTYSIVAMVYVAQVGEKKVESLAEALSLAQAGDTVTLLANISENVTISRSVTIEGADFDYTGTMTANKDGLNVVVKNVDFIAGNFVRPKNSGNSGWYTFDGCTFDGNATGSYALNLRGTNTVTIKNCTAEDYPYGFLQIPSTNDRIYVENVTVKGVNYAFKIDYSNAVSFKNVNVENVTYGIMDSNYGTKTYTLNGYNAINTTNPIYVWERAAAKTDTFQFVGVSDLGLTADKLNFGQYAVVKAASVIGTKIYGSIQDAIDNVENGTTIPMFADATLTTASYVTVTDDYAALCAVKEKNVTIDLNGKVITVNASAADVADAEMNMLFAVFAVDTNGNLTLTDSSVNGTGAVNVVANDATVYSVAASYGEGGKLTIDNGSYTADTLSNCLIYAQHKECVTVNNGNFHLGNVGTGANGSPWIFNTKGQNVTGVTVNGGTYNTDINHSFWANEVFVPGGLALRDNGNGTWTVVPAVAYIMETATSTGSTAREVGYATLADAFAAAKAGHTVTLSQNIVLENALTVEAGKDFTLDLNGKTVSMDDASGKGTYAITNKGTLTIKDSSTDETGKITFNSTTPSSNYGYATSTIGNAGKLTIESGNIENTTVGGASYAVDGIWHTEEVSLTISGGTFTATQIAVRQVPFSATANNIVTISGGTFNGAAAGLQLHHTSNVANLSEVNISGGTFNGDYAFYTSFAGAIASDNATINITGGEFNGWPYIYNGANGSSEYPMSVSVSGGTFDGIEIYTKDASGNIVGIPAISGGIYNNPVEAAYCADDYAPVAFEDGTYGVEYLKLETLEIIDRFGEFENANEKHVSTLTYKRTMPAAGIWQAFYVPFEVPVQTLIDLGYDVAYFLDVHFEISEDAGIDMTKAPDVHLIKIKQGTLKANYPYVIRASQTADLNLEIELNDVKLYRSDASAMNSVECSSTMNTFKFSGLYTRMECDDFAGEAPCYAIGTDGYFQKFSGDITLPAFRVYMTIEAKDGSPVIFDDATAPQTIRMRVIGEENWDGTTSIYDVVVDTNDNVIYDLQGRRVAEPQKGEIYIINGEKVIY